MIDWAGPIASSTKFLRHDSKHRMKSVFDRSFRYTPSFGTDLKATFARVRRELRAQAEEAAAEAKNKVLPIKQNKMWPGA